MKTYKHLFDNMLDLSEIESAIVEASHGKATRNNVSQILAHKHDAAIEVQRILLNGYTPYKHERGTIQEGRHRKLRDDIQKPAFWPEQIIHHLIVRQLKPILIPRMADNVGGMVSGQDLHRYKPHLFQANKKVRGRGASWAAKRMARWRDGYHGKKFYVLETDVKSFYDSIDINILYEKLCHYVKDERFLKLCRTILSRAGPGIPKGYYTSPWFAQLYFMDTDNYIQQELKPDHYLRYMDNMFLFSKNKRKLRSMRDNLQNYLVSNLQLSLNGSTQVYKFEQSCARGRAIECLGFIIHRDRITIRKNIIKRIRAKSYRIDRLNRWTLHNCTAMLSYKGWFKHTNSRKYYERYIKPHTSWRKLRRKLRRIMNAKLDNRAVHGKAG